MNETTLLEQLLEYKKSLQLAQKTNESISEHLVGSIIQILKYGEKYNIVIPKRDLLEQILLNTRHLWNEHNLAVDKFNQKSDKNMTNRKVTLPKPTEDETEPGTRFCIICG
jgi:hypothetical protein